MTASPVTETARRSVLGGVRVVEMADWIAGPFAASVLSDFGAEVIRIDLPGKVANTRTLYGLEDIDAERSPFFAIFAHDKKSITLDVRGDAGREVFLNLVRHSDVLIEGFRPGTMERWGIGWDTLHELNPGLVMLRISGYGQTGPWKDRPGLDRVAQAFAGASSVLLATRASCRRTRTGLRGQTRRWAGCIIRGGSRAGRSSWLVRRALMDTSAMLRRQGRK